MIDISLDAFSDKVYKSVRIGGDLKITKKMFYAYLKLTIYTVILKIIIVLWNKKFT